MSKFVQIIEVRTSRRDELLALNDEAAAAMDEMSVLRVLDCTDRDDPNLAVTICEFPSWEAAQANNELEVTQRLAEQVSKLAEAPPVFRNLDVVDEFTR